MPCLPPEIALLMPFEFYQAAQRLPLAPPRKIRSRSPLLPRRTKTGSSRPPIRRDRKIHPGHRKCAAKYPRRFDIMQQEPSLEANYFNMGKPLGNSGRFQPTNRWYLCGQSGHVFPTGRQHGTGCQAINCCHADIIRWSKDVERISKSGYEISRTIYSAKSMITRISSEGFPHMLASPKCGNPLKMNLGVPLWLRTAPWIYP